MVREPMTEVGMKATASRSVMMGVCLVLLPLLGMHTSAGASPNGQSASVTGQSYDAPATFAYATGRGTAPAPIEYVALGDSYSSGTGAGSYDVRTDTKWNG